MKRRPGDALAWNELGHAAAEAGEIEEARYALSQAVYLAPQDLEHGVAAAEALLAIGCVPDAEHAYRRLLERAPAAGAARLGLARVLLASGNEPGALAEIASALRDDPRNVGLRLFAAELADGRGALAEAADHLAAVLAVDLEHGEANQRLAVTLEQLGDLNGAVRCWRRVVAASGGKDLDAVVRLGIALSSDGQHAEAIQILHEVVARRPDSAAAHANLGMALLGAGRVEDALTSFGRALELDPQLAQAHCGIGLAHQREGRWQQAADAFRMTEQLAPEHVVGAFNLGLALAELGDKEGARRALLRAAALDPEDEEIRHALEEFLAREGVPREVTVEEPSIPMSMKGNLSSFQLFDVLEFLRLQNKTGALVVSSRKGAGIVRLVDGRLTSAWAPGVKRLGDMMVERGVARRIDVDAALARQAPGDEESRDGVGTLLVKQGRVPREAVAKLVLDQVMAALDEMTTWTEGAFSFQPAEESEPPPIVFDLQKVMLEFLRTSDERKHAARTSPR